MHKKTGKRRKEEGEEEEEESWFDCVLRGQIEILFVPIDFNIIERLNSGYRILLILLSYIFVRDECEII